MNFFSQKTLALSCLIGALSLHTRPMDTLDQDAFEAPKYEAAESGWGKTIRDIAEAARDKAAQAAGAVQSLVGPESEAVKNISAAPLVQNPVLEEVIEASQTEQIAAELPTKVEKLETSTSVIESAVFGSGPSTPIAEGKKNVVQQKLAGSFLTWIKNNPGTLVGRVVIVAAAVVGGYTLWTAEYVQPYKKRAADNKKKVVGAAAGLVAAGLLVANYCAGVPFFVLNSK